MTEQLHTLIPLTNGGYSWIDLEDLPRVRQHGWFKRIDGNMVYAQTNIKVRHKKYLQIGLHRFILGTPKGKHTDHVNRNGLDNRKSNLRVVDQAQNAWNRPQFKNARLLPSGRWSSEIEVRAQKFYLGVYSSKEAAENAYTQAAEWLRGKDWV